MGIRVDIRDASVEEVSMNGRNGSYQVRRQYGWVALPSGEVRKVRLRLAQGVKPHAVGSYLLGDASFVVGEYGDLQLGNLELLPAPAVEVPARASVSAAR